MAQLVSNQDGLTINGRRYAAGEPIPSDSIKKLPERRIRQMIDQHKVQEDRTRVSGKKER